MRVRSKQETPNFHVVGQRAPLPIRRQADRLPYK